MLSFYQKLTAAGIRALVYTGDVDMSVNSLGTEESLTVLQQNAKSSVVDEWRSWHTNGQVSGWTKKWSNDVTFVTVRGAGHMVPTSKPVESLIMFERFLNNQPMPK
jgi:carboxypeptidase C (cathepsin A)